MCLLFASSVAWAAGPTGYYRFPAIHGETVIFTSEGDLWQVPVQGGMARRLTSHAGAETRASISPDGTMVAFTGQYEGPSEVYVMPIAGGAPQRLTWESRDARVAGWTADGRVMYSTDAYSTLPNRQLATVDPKTGIRALLPLAQANEGVYAGATLIFTRLPKQNSSTKRYRGGWVENLWSFGPGDDEASPLTGDFDGTCRNPMWWDGHIYFISDRDGVMNLWSMRPDGAEPTQLTRFNTFDVKSAALDEGRIVYQLGADLRLLDLVTGADGVLGIALSSDLDQRREQWVKKPAEYLTSSHISPTGDRVALTARGRVFVAPSEQGRFVEVPGTPGARLRDARFWPDGKSLLLLSDETGELEFWKYGADGLAKPSQVTSNGTVFRSGAIPSPDGSWFVWGDKDYKLWAYQTTRKEMKLIAESATGEITDFAWSSDGKWLAYVERAANTYRQVKIFRVEDGMRATVTSDRTDSFSPAWSPDGKWLYFLSDRELRSLVRSPQGMRQPEPYFTETTKIFQVSLAKGTRSPFAPRDELDPDSPRPVVRKVESADGEKLEIAEKKTETSPASTPPERRMVWIDWITSPTASWRCRCRRGITTTWRRPPGTFSGSARMSDSRESGTSGRSRSRAKIRSRKHSSRSSIATS